MGKKSGKAPKAVPPAAPEKAEEAAEAKAGKAGKAKAGKAGKSGEQKKSESKTKDMKAHKEATTEEEKEEQQEEGKTSWIEIEMVGEDDEAIPGEKYRIILPDGETYAEGTLDEKGFARVEGFEKGTCKVCFPNIDKEAWEKILMAHAAYKVKLGDCISSIAFKHGLFPGTVWDDPKNSKLKEERKNPNILAPGDVVHVRDIEEKEEDCASEERHRFRKKGVPEKLIVQFKIGDKPRADEDYVLDIDGALSEGKTDKDGKIDIWIPPDAKKGKITFREGGASTSLISAVSTPSARSRASRDALAISASTPGRWTAR